MSLLDLLNKYGVQHKPLKIKAVQELEMKVKEIEDKSYTCTIKTMYDFYLVEILMQSLLQKQIVDKTYQRFHDEQYDTLSYTTYDQRQKMFEVDLQKEIKDFCFFEDQNQHKIYLPHLDTLMNERYFHDYQAILLKSHQLDLKSSSKLNTSVIQYYGVTPLCSMFSRLETIDIIDDVVWLYDQEIGYLLVVNNDGILKQECCFHDKYATLVPSIEQMKRISAYYKEENYDAILQLLVDSNLISQKNYKKIKKKVG